MSVENDSDKENKTQDKNMNIRILFTKRLFEFLDEEEETENMEDAVVMGDCEGNVEIRDVSFSYEPGTTLLEHMNVSAKKGDRIAIVGSTGCGKTTIINLLMR